MPVNEPVAFATLEDLAAGLRREEYTSLELTEFFLDRCERLGPAYNAVVTTTRDLALAQAQRADEERSAGRLRGPLHGIPCGIKDLLATKGYPTSWGAAPFKDQRIDEDATVVARLREAGAVLVAKLSMVEIAGGLGYRQANAAFNGPGLNPWDPSRWSGGSSSGPGSAVAAGLVPFAIGSETWGSIVTPAAYCGLSGLRPTYGRVSRHGAMTLSWTMDKLGPLCHTAHECGLVLDAIAGADPHDPSCVDRPYAYPEDAAPPPAPPFRLATLPGAADRAQGAVRAAYRDALEVLGGFAEIEEIELPGLPYSTVADTILSAEAAAAFQSLVISGQIADVTAPEDRYRLYADLAIPATDYINATRIRGHIQRALDELLSRCDAIVTPSRATVAGPIDQSFSEWSRGFSSTPIGGAANVAGLPGLSVPSGFDAHGLPAGIEFTGRAFEENRLIAIASEYQRRTDWHTRHPPLTRA